MSFYTRSSVTVDKDFVRFGQRTYPVPKVSSVETRTLRPYGLEGCWASLIIAAIAALAAAASFAGALGPADGIMTGCGLAACAALLALLATWQYRRAQTVDHYVCLTVATNSMHCTKMADEQDAQALHDAIEAAISFRPPA